MISRKSAKEWQKTSIKISLLMTNRWCLLYNCGYYTTYVLSMSIILSSLYSPSKLLWIMFFSSITICRFKQNRKWSNLNFYKSNCFKKQKKIRNLLDIHHFYLRTWRLKYQMSLVCHYPKHLFETEISDRGALMTKSP